MHADRNSRALPSPGTPAYWRASRDGYALLAEVKAALDAYTAACDRLALCAATDAKGESELSRAKLASPCPEEDADVTERQGGVGAWERAYALIETAWLHPFAARVMQARGLVPGSAFCTVHHRLP